MHVEETETKPRRTYQGVEGALRAYLRDRGAEEVLNAVIAKHLVGYYALNNTEKSSFNRNSTTKRLFYSAKMNTSC